MSVVSWVQCNRCDKWRIVPNADELGDDWFCEMNPNVLYNTCDKEEEPFVENPNVDDPVPMEPVRRKGQEDFMTSIKQMTDEQLNEYWSKIDWQAFLNWKWAQIPKEIPAEEYTNWMTIDDTAWVDKLDAEMRLIFPAAISKQIPRLSSAVSQERKLLEFLRERGRI